MNVKLVKSVTEIVDISKKDEKSPLITEDKAKFITLTITGKSISVCIAETVAALLSVIDPSTNPTVYLQYGEIVSNMNGSSHTMVVGVSGMMDLDVKLSEYINSNSNNAENIQVVGDNENKDSEEDAEIVEA